VNDLSSDRANHMHHMVNNKERQIWLWHHRLGHPSFGYLKHLFPDLFSNTMHSNFKCNTCILAKSHRVSYPVSMNKNAIPFALIHSNVWGPSPVTTSSGHRWFVIFVDDCTRMTWLYLLKHKDEVFGVFKSFHWFRHNFLLRFRSFVLTMEGNMLIGNFRHTFRVMVFSMRPRVLRPHNKMVLPKGITDIS
jgi:hypothetical protein